MDIILRALGTRACPRGGTRKSWSWTEHVVLPVVHWHPGDVLLLLVWVMLRPPGHPVHLFPRGWDHRPTPPCLAKSSHLNLNSGSWSLGGFPFLSKPFPLSRNISSMAQSLEHTVLVGFFLEPMSRSACLPPREAGLGLVIGVTSLPFYQDVASTA